jgi:hypothetical protein
MGKQIGKEKNPLTQRYIENGYIRSTRVPTPLLEKESTQLFTTVIWRGKKPGDK